MQGLPKLSEMKLDVKSKFLMIGTLGLLALLGMTSTIQNKMDPVQLNSKPLALGNSKPGEQGLVTATVIRRVPAPGSPSVTVTLRDDLGHTATIMGNTNQLKLLATGSNVQFVATAVGGDLLSNPSQIKVLKGKAGTTDIQLNNIKLLEYSDNQYMIKIKNGYEEPITLLIPVYLSNKIEERSPIYQTLTYDKTTNEIIAVDGEE